MKEISSKSSVSETAGKEDDEEEPEAEDLAEGGLSTTEGNLPLRVASGAKAPVEINWMTLIISRKGPDMKSRLYAAVALSPGETW